MQKCRIAINRALSEARCNAQYDIKGKGAKDLPLRRQGGGGGGTGGRL